MDRFDARTTARMSELDGAPLASFAVRGAAFLLDVAAAALLFAAVTSLVEPLLLRLGWIQTRQDIVFALNLNWYSIAWTVAYFGLATYVGNGKTPGKWVFGIRTVSLAHRRITLWHSVERALGYGFSAMEFFFGYLQYFLYPNRRTLHDRIADTIVIRDRRRIKEQPAVAPQFPEGVLDDRR